MEWGTYLIEGLQWDYSKKFNVFCSMRDTGEQCLSHAEKSKRSGLIGFNQHFQVLFGQSTLVFPLDQEWTTNDRGLVRELYYVLSYRYTCFVTDVRALCSQ